MSNSSVPSKDLTTHTITVKSLFAVLIVVASIVLSTSSWVWSTKIDTALSAQAEQYQRVNHTHLLEEIEEIKQTTARIEGSIEVLKQLHGVD